MILINPPDMPSLADMFDEEQCKEQCKHFYLVCICQTLDLWPF
jgi:hypothetical protein